jgi:hypothetical protein
VVELEPPEVEGYEPLVRPAELELPPMPEPLVDDGLEPLP